MFLVYSLILTIGPSEVTCCKSQHLICIYIAYSWAEKAAVYLKKTMPFAVAIGSTPHPQLT
jgi:hypothetical protein